MPTLIRPYACAALLALAAVGTAPLQAQTFPVKPIRIVVPVPPGGSVDTVVRLIVPRLSELMGQSVVIDNRPGAATNIGTDHVAKSAPDGYTLLASAVPLVANASLYSKLPYNVERDFAAVTLVATTPHVMAVHPSLPVKGIADLVKLARAKPGAIHYSSSGAGTNLHIAAELFKYLTKTDMVHVPYKGGGPALTALLAGECEMSVLSLVATASQVSAGRLRAVGITSAKRSHVLPELPTIAEQGVPGYDFSSWVGIVAPAATPPAIVKALQENIAKAATSPDVRERFLKDGADVVVNTPDEYRRFLADDLRKWARVIKESNIRLD